MDAVEYSRLSRDTKRENDTAEWLLSVDEENRCTFLWQLAEQNPLAACVLIKKSQLSPVSLKAFLDYGLVNSDTSSVQWWLKATHQGIGPTSLITSVSAYLDRDPLTVYKALYFLPTYFRDDDEYKAATQSLRSDFDSRYPDYTPSG